jgi:hypothetical protein
VPDFTIRGNPAAIRERARLTSEKATLFDDTGEALSKIDVTGWTGRAADHFRDAHDLEPDRWFKAGNGFRKTGAALSVYADALEDAQAVATWAEEEYARGDDSTDEYRHWFSSETDRLQTGLRNGTYSSITLPVWDDPGNPIRSEAIRQFNDALATLENAAQVCAGEVKAGCADAPEEPSWWESGLRFVGGIFQGAGEALWDIATMLPFSPANLIQDAWALATGELTPEELAKTYELDWETAVGMWDALREDPVEFGKNLGKGLLDWDTWADDPARAIGHLVPDAIAALATGGAGAVATRGTKGSLDVLDVLSDLGKLDNLGDLAKLDELGSLSRLDELGELGTLDRARVYSMMDDLPHTTAYSPEQLGSGRIDDVLGNHGLDRDGFIDLVNKPADELTAAERASLSSVRDDLPMPTSDTVMQKVIPPEVADRYIMGRDHDFQVDSVRGAVTDASDTAHLGTPQQLHDGLRLDYENSPYSPDDPATHVIRFQTDTPDFEVPRHSDMGGSGQFDDWGDPFTGNGFTKSGDDIIPEYATGPDGVTMRDGAEMWETLDDGTQRLVAVLRNGEWIPQGN